MFKLKKVKTKIKAIFGFFYQKIYKLFSKYNYAIKNSYIISICFLVVILVTITLFNKFKLNEKKSYNNNILTENESREAISLYNKHIVFLKEYMENNEFKIKNDIKNRAVILDFKKSSIIIGNNEKELKNNYFDICISANTSYVGISINKLFKEVVFDNSKMLDINYLNELVNLLDSSLDLKLGENEKITLVQAIEKNYLKIRTTENIDELSSILDVKELKISEYKIVFVVCENMLRMECYFN